VIQVTCTLYNGTTVVDTATDNAAADVLLPGESSPFDDLFFSAHLYDHYSCAVTGPSTASHADHNFTTTITSVTTDASNNQHINGSVVNNESVTVQGVNTYLTFYGTTGAVVDTLTVSVNEGDSIQPGLANAVTFNAVRTSNRPTWALSSGLNKLTEAPAPDVSLSASQLSFGSQVIGTTSATQTLTVSNVGTADLTIPAHGVTLNGNNPSDFLISADQCSGHTVAPDGGTCTVGISFHPTDYGDRSAGVSVADNADGTPQAVTLSGSRAQPGTDRRQPGADGLRNSAGREHDDHQPDHLEHGAGRRHHYVHHAEQWDRLQHSRRDLRRVAGGRIVVQPARDVLAARERGQRLQRYGHHRCRGL